MKFVQFFLLTMLSLILVSGVYPGLSVAQTDAYSLEVAVSERSESEQQEAYMAALRRVLLNNSGDKTILNRDLVRQALNEAETYVQSFSYRRPPLGTVIASDTPTTTTVRQTGQATQLMLVSFERQLVNLLISGSEPGSSQADKSAPTADAFVASNSALVWLLIRDDDRDIFISDNAAANVQNRAREIAGAAGISLVYPTGDQEDFNNLPAEVLVAQNFDPLSLQNMSERYAQSTLLIGYMTRIGARGWQSQWTQLAGDQQRQSQFETSSLDEGLQQGLGMLSSVAQVDETFRYGGSAVSGTEALLWVGSVNSTEDYATIMNFLQEVPGVSTVYPKEINSTSMVFSVVPRNALSGIESALFDAPWLRRTAPPVSTDRSSLLGNVDLALDFVP